MKIREENWEKYAELEVTKANYCQACGEDFIGIEVVFYAPIDNNIICKDCASEHNEKEPRLFVEGAW